MVITTQVDSLTRSSAAALIRGYQRHISPKKGFSCAYRVTHGKESCSEFIKRTILEQGLIEAIPAARHRLQACKAADQVLRSKIETPDPNKEAQRGVMIGMAAIWQTVVVLSFLKMPVKQLAAALKLGRDAPAAILTLTVEYSIVAVQIVEVVVDNLLIEVFNVSAPAL